MFTQFTNSIYLACEWVVKMTQIDTSQLINQGVELNIDHNLGTQPLQQVFCIRNFWNVLWQGIGNGCWEVLDYKMTFLSGEVTATCVSVRALQALKFQGIPRPCIYIYRHWDVLGWFTSFWLLTLTVNNTGCLSIVTVHSNHC